MGGGGADIVLLLLKNGFWILIVCKSPDSPGSDDQIRKGQPVGGAVQQQTTAAAAVPSEVTDHLDQPGDDPNVTASSLGCLPKVTSYTQVRFTAAAICSRLEVRLFQGDFLISVLGFTHIQCSWQPYSGRFHNIF